MAEKRGLGRGLSALLGDVEDTNLATGSGDVAGVREAPIELLKRNEDQPRWLFPDEELKELADSIRDKGVLQPILVRPLPNGEYQIVAGERRWRASQLAGLKTMPILVRELDDRMVLEIAVIENVQRSNLNAIEEATAYSTLINKFGHTQEGVATAVGKSRSHVANTLRLMNLPDPVRAYLVNGQITAGHARAILNAEDPVALAERIVAGGLSVRDAEALARKAAAGGAGPSKTTGVSRKPVKDTDTLALESDLADVLGLDVEVLDRGGEGELRIKYATLEQLDELCRRLTAKA